MYHLLMDARREKGKTKEGNKKKHNLRNFIQM